MYYPEGSGVTEVPGRVLFPAGPFLGEAEALSGAAVSEEPALGGVTPLLSPGAVDSVPEGAVWLSEGLGAVVSGTGG